MKSFDFSSYAVSIAVGAASLAGCGAVPVSLSPGAIPQSHTTASSATRIPSDLYVVDAWGRRVVEFDDHGKKIAVRSIDYWRPFDVVTDSHGNVYVVGGHKVGPSQFKYAVQELSHDLRKRLALYSLNSTGPASHLTIDGADNLYVFAYERQLGYYVAEYPYGSTTMSKEYTIGPSVCLEPVGISVNGTLLLAPMSSSGAPQGTCVYTCQIGVSGACSYSTFIWSQYGYGFTTTRRFSAYTFFGSLMKYTVDGSKFLYALRLPPGYSFGGRYGFCNLHNHGEFVWGGMRSYGVKPSHPAVAVEFDMVHNKIRAMVGAHDLHTPLAAYYGNGYVP